MFYCNTGGRKYLIPEIIQGVPTIAVEYNTSGLCTGIVNLQEINTLSNVQVVSLLKSQNKINIGVQYNDRFVEFDIAETNMQTIVQQFRFLTNVVDILRNKGEFDGVNFVQTLVVFTGNTNLDYILRKVGIICG